MYVTQSMRFETVCVSEHTPRPPPCRPSLARPAPGTDPAPFTATPAPLELTPTATPSLHTPVPVTQLDLEQTTEQLEQPQHPAGGQV